MPGYRTVRVSELTPGSVLATSIFDTHSQKLLDADTAIDQHLLDRLGALGITEVMVESAAETVTKPLETSSPSGVKVPAIEGSPSTPAIDRCSSCGAIIALQPPTPNARVSTWLCKTCGAIYFGSEDGGAGCCGVTRCEADANDASGARFKVNMEAASPPIPPKNVQRLIKSLVPGEYTGPDRRAHKRYPVTVPVVVLPLTSDFRIDGEPIQMTTVNISLGGAALMYTRFLDAPYLALDFSIAGVELLQVILKVLRVHSTGPVYEMAGQFISRLSQPPG
jgi:hypothetical protein